MPPKKKLVKTFTLQLPAGQATPAPPVGPALGQHGVNIMEFVKRYNAETESMRGDIVPAQISVFEDRSFQFILKTPPAAQLLIKAAGVQKGSGVPQQGQGRRDQPRAAARDRAEEDGRPQRERHRGRREDHRRYRPLDGHHRSRTDRRQSVGGRRRRPAINHRRFEDMQRSKNYRKVAEQIDRSALYSPAEAVKLAKQTTTVKFDPTVEVAMRLGRRPAQGRPDGPRHGQPAARHRQDRPRDRVRGRREGRRGRGRRRRRGGHRRAGRPHPGRLARLRRRDRHARPDGQDRPDRADPGPARPDAEPEDGHRHDGRHQGRHRHQGRKDHLPGRQARQPAPDHRQGQLHRRAADRQLRRGARRGAADQAVGGEGQVPEEGLRDHDDGPRHPGRPEPHPQPARGRRRPPPDRDRSPIGPYAHACGPIWSPAVARRVLLPRSSTRRPLVTMVHAWSKAPPRGGRPAQDGRSASPARGSTLTARPFRPVRPAPGRLSLPGSARPARGNERGGTWRTSRFGPTRPPP